MGDGVDRGRLLRWGYGRNGCGGEPDVGFEVICEVPGRSQGEGCRGHRVVGSRSGDGL